MEFTCEALVFYPCLTLFYFINFMILIKFIANIVTESYISMPIRPEDEAIRYHLHVFDFFILQKKRSNYLVNARWFDPSFELVIQTCSDWSGRVLTPAGRVGQVRPIKARCGMGLTARPAESMYPGAGITAFTFLSVNVCLD
jgi:hypothetical protein